jgi:glycosyltransferase involved in cell wall biosynthesis
MKVLHVIPSVSPLRGGPSVMLRTMTRGLVQAGIEVDVATTDDNGPERLHGVNSKPVIEAGVTYRYFPRQTKFYTFSWLLTRWLAQHVRDYDLVHIHALFSYAAIPAAYWARRHRVPYIVRPLGVLNHWGMKNRHPWLKKVSLKLIESRIIAGASAIHYTSEQERLEATKLRVKQRCIVIPNAAEIPIHCGNLARGQFRAQNPELTDRFIILFLSRLDSVKGLDILLPAFARLRTNYPQARLVIAGKGDSCFTKQLRCEADQLAIRDIFWAGFLTDEEKWAALADADIFVLPSYSENFGVAAVEAMACGVPVVVSDQIGVYREVSAARAGVVVPCRSAELAQALDKLAHDPALRAEMGENGRQLARRKFFPEAVTGSLLSLYQNICTATGKGVRAERTFI